MKVQLNLLINMYLRLAIIKILVLISLHKQQLSVKGKTLKSMQQQMTTLVVLLNILLMSNPTNKTLSEGEVPLSYKNPKNKQIILP